MKYLFLFFLLLANLFGFSQGDENPVVWQASYTDKDNLEGEIKFTAIINPNWHIYSQRPTDAGPIPTSFTITPNSNFELIDKVSEDNAHEEFVKAFEAKVFVFEKQAVFTQKIKRKGKKAFSINSNVEYMTCNDMQCLPPKIINLTVSVPSLKKSKVTDVQISVLSN